VLRTILSAVLCLLFAGPSLATPGNFNVGLVASNDATLRSPVARDSSLTVAQVEAMVRAAVERAGGLRTVVPDTSRLVVLKPNVVADVASGSGVVTDARVVRAVALIVHEIAPQARILIAEGSGGWISPALVDCVKTNVATIADGFEIAGHRATVKELRARGIDIDCYDLNFDRVRKLVPPTGGLSMDEYELAATIFEADAWINCPVAKTHGTKITCCLKNQFGLFPGNVYGWNKSRGTRNHRGIPHAPRLIDETFIDLLSLTEPDFHVVDMITGAEGGAFQGQPKRSNLIVAGADAIATDLVVARLMGFNPDDFEYADLGALHGIGPGSIDAVSVRGGDPRDLASRFKKASMDYTSEWAEHAGFGMGPRYWTLLGPLDADHTFAQQELDHLAPTPGQEGWSTVVRFGDDRIDLDKYFEDPTHCAVYAFTRFTMANSDSVRLWISSDEDLEVWIDGRQVHHFEGRRRHVLGSTRAAEFIEAGEHSLLVRAGQTRGRFDFSINICEPIDDRFYAGNRYPGVRYYVTHPGPVASLGRQVEAEHVREDWMKEPLYERNLDAPDPIESERAAPDSILVAATWATMGSTFFDVAAQAAQIEPGILDSITTAVIAEAPFHFAWWKSDGWYPRYGPAPGRVLSWLNLRYDVRAGYRHRESFKVLRGWLALGHAPITGWGTDRWDVITGTRHGPERVEFRVAGSDSAAWVPFEDKDWWARFPGDRWFNCPILVVEPDGPPPPLVALVDSIATLALDMGTRCWVTDDVPMAWGDRRLPAGLAGWDAWVEIWRDYPLDRAGLEAADRRREDYSELGDWALTGLASRRRLASEYFAHAAMRLPSDRRHADLLEAAAGYADVVVALDSLIADLPTTGSGDWTDDDLLRLERLPSQRDAWERARAGERRALSALAHMLGAADLPPARAPRDGRDSGQQLFTWKADLSSGVYDLHFVLDDVRLEHLFGRLPEGASTDFLAAFPRESGWQLAVQRHAGEGLYQVLQQPTADNDWTAVLRIDDAGTYRNVTDLSVWAVASDSAAAIR
jgi:uncharacterized protein (DUF362 family)